MQIAYCIVPAVAKILEQAEPLVRNASVAATEVIREAIVERMRTLAPSEHGKWTRVLTLLPAAPINTIHGFCGKLLRENGLHAGIDPSFVQWNSRWGADLAFGRLPDATDEQKLHGLEFQWFAVLQSRLLTDLSRLQQGGGAGTDSG